MIKNELPYSKEDYDVRKYATAEINCPDIHIVEPSNDALELVQMLSSN